MQITEIEKTFEKVVLLYTDILFINLLFVDSSH